MPSRKRVEKARPRSPTGLTSNLPVIVAQSAFRDLTSSPQRLMMQRDRGPAVGPLVVPSCQRSATPTSSGILSSLAASPVLLPPASSSGAIIAARMREVENYIRDEVSLLASGGNDGLGGQQRLAIFKAAFRMALPLVHPDLCGLFERVVAEYEAFTVELESRSLEGTLVNERKKVEKHYESHYLQVIQRKEKDLQTRVAEFEKLQASVEKRCVALENQAQQLREENQRLRQQQSEDHERLLSLAQSLVDARLASQTAESAQKEAEAQLHKLQFTEKYRTDILEDAIDMLKALRTHKIDFAPRYNYLSNIVDQQMRR